MKSRHNTRLIRKRRTYTAKEIAVLLGVHTRTVQQWVSKEGLKPLEGSSNPYLIYGEELVLFLDNRRQSQKCSLQPDEFYCFKCKAGRRSVSSELKDNKTSIRIGNKGKLKAEKTGICEVCGIKLYRYFTYLPEATE